MYDRFGEAGLEGDFNGSSQDTSQGVCHLRRISNGFKNLFLTNNLLDFIYFTFIRWIHLTCTVHSLEVLMDSLGE